MTAVLALVLALQQAPAPSAPAAPAAPGTAAPAAPAPVRRPAPTSSTVQVHVTDRTGAPVSGVTVSADGPTSREGQTDASGNVSFRSVANGTYRMRASGTAFITLEKEVTIRAGVTQAPIDFALSAAPPPPPPPPPAPEPPPPPPAPTQADVKPGEVRVVSIVDMWEKTPTPKEASRQYPIACSGLDRAEMLVIRETYSAPADPNTDRMLYVVGGEALLALGGRDQVVTNGWFAMVPRGTSQTWTRRGRNPVVILSMAGGQPCAK